jgi:hypothetical protein
MLLLLTIPTLTCSAGSMSDASFQEPSPPRSKAKKAPSRAKAKSKPLVGRDGHRMICLTRSLTRSAMMKKRRRRK